MVARITGFRLDDSEYRVIGFPLRRPRAFAALTAAELAIAEGAIEGASTRALARARGVSERTVANQLASIYRKLGVYSRQELVALVCGALDRGEGIECGSVPGLSTS
jgi:DNA-binding NarL/FixJ family response regulator